MTDEPEEPEDEADEQPDIDDEEMADFGAVAEDIEDEAGAGAGEDEDADEEQTDQDDDPEMGMEPDPDRVSIGTVYCNGLGMGAAVARTSWGSAEEDEREDLMEDYRGVAEQLEIDQCVDDWLEEHGGVDELSPGQATVVLTALWAGMVAMDDPDMVGNIAGEVGS